MQVDSCFLASFLLRTTVNRQSVNLKIPNCKLLHFVLVEKKLYVINW